jgi:predicted phage-related endonuclease
MNRKGFIGGSDCVKIMNGDWYELWQVKTGRAESDDLSDNLPVQLGITTEDFNLSWFEKQTGKVVAAHQKEYITTIGTVPVKGTIDGGIRGERNIIEAKHTNAFTNMDEQISRYMPQIQLYMHVANATGAYLSIIFGNSKWEQVHIAYDEEYFNSMWAVVSDFWGYVVRDEEPIGIDVPSFSTEKIEVDSMVVRDATLDNQFVDAAVTYVNGIEQNRTFENAKKDLKSMVADNEREVYCDYITIKRDKRGALRITKRN